MSIMVSYLMCNIELLDISDHFILDSLSDQKMGVTIKKVLVMKVNILCIPIFEWCFVIEVTFSFLFPLTKIDMGIGHYHYHWCSCCCFILI